MADLDQVSADLYALRPQEFIAGRDAEAKAARAAGDRELAGALLTLRKPTVSAWLMNLLVRDDASLAPQLVALGEGLRAAESSLDGDQMRALNGQRRQLVAALVGRARRLALAVGHRLGDSVVQELDQTLTAALADPDVAAEVLSGRLTGPREHVGFGSATAGGQHLTVVRDEPAPAAQPKAAVRPKAAVPRGRAAGAGAGAGATTARRLDEETTTLPRRRDAAELRAREEATRAREAGERREREEAARRGRDDAARRAREEARAAAEAAQAELDRARAELLAAQERQQAADAVAAEADQSLTQWKDLADSARLKVTRTEKELRKLAAALNQVKARLGNAEQRVARAKDELSGARHEAKAAVVAVRAARDAVTTATRAAERTNRG